MRRPVLATWTLALGLTLGTALSAACPISEPLRSFDTRIDSTALPAFTGASMTKAEARVMLAQLEEFRLVHLEGYRQELGRYGAYIIDTDTRLERNRRRCGEIYEALHQDLVTALKDIKTIHRAHYSAMAQQYKTRVRFAKRAIVLS